MDRSRCFSCVARKFTCEIDFGDAHRAATLGDDQIRPVFAKMDSTPSIRMSDGIVVKGTEFGLLVRPKVVAEKVHMAECVKSMAGIFFARRVEFRTELTKIPFEFRA